MDDFIDEYYEPEMMGDESGLNHTQSSFYSQDEIDDCHFIEMFDKIIKPYISDINSCILDRLRCDGLNSFVEFMRNNTN